jgi:hypothetical protein
LQDEEGGIAFADCPNLLCDRVVAYVPDTSDPFCRVFCGRCHVEAEFVNPFFISPDEEDQEAES